MKKLLSAILVVALVSAVVFASSSKTEFVDETINLSEINRQTVVDDANFNARMRWIVDGQLQAVESTPDVVAIDVAGADQQWFAIGWVNGLGKLRLFRSDALEGKYNEIFVFSINGSSTMQISLASSEKIGLVLFENGTPTWQSDESFTKWTPVLVEDKNQFRLARNG